LYVTDVVDAFFRAATCSASGSVWNLGAGNPQSVNRLVELLNGPVQYIPRRPGEPDVTWADISKIRADLEWEPTVAFEEGVGLMLADLDHWRNAPLWDATSIASATRTWFKHLGSEGTP